MAMKNITEIEELLSENICIIEKSALDKILEENMGCLGDISESISSLNFKSQTVKNAMKDFISALEAFSMCCEKSEPEAEKINEEKETVVPFIAPQGDLKIYKLIHPSGVDATGYALPSGGFVIRKGSKFIRTELQPSTGSGNILCRQNLLDNSNMDDDGVCVLSSDITTLSAAQASSGLLGGNRHASAWRDENGETFKTARIEKSTLPVLEEHLKSRYPGVIANGRQRWVRGADVYFLRMKLSNNEVNGFTCKLDDTDGLDFPVYVRQYISMAHGRIYEISFDAIEPFMDKSAKSVQITFSQPDSEGCSEVFVSGKATHLRCLGLSPASKYDDVA